MAFTMIRNSRDVVMEDFESFKNRLLSTVDLSEVISSYIPIKKKGSRFFAKCPFHNEHDESLCINETYYHCFGCQASGNAITFVMQYESISFMEALKVLAQKYNLEIPRTFSKSINQNDYSKRTKLLSLMEDTRKFYCETLSSDEGKAAREYLKNRRILDTDISYYSIGLSPNKTSLFNYLNRKGYATNDMLECGVITQAKTDFFSERIIVPIFNARNECIAFGARKYKEDQGGGKYINSGDTYLFKKGENVFGANYIKRERKSQNPISEIILVEGYMDVISLGSAGIKNAVAGMGTALKTTQCNEIRRLTDSVICCYDGDEAGLKATENNIPTLLSAGLNTKVATLDYGMDPDDVIKTSGKEGFIAKINTAKGAIDYLIDYQKKDLDLNSVDDQIKFKSKIQENVLSKMPDEYLQIITNTIEKNFGISVSKTEEKINKAPITRLETQQNTKIDLAAQMRVLDFMLKKAVFFNIKDLERDLFTNNLCKAAYDIISNNFSSESDKIIAELFIHFQNIGEKCEDKTNFVKKLITINGFKYNEMMDADCRNVDNEYETYIKNLRMLRVNLKKQQNRSAYNSLKEKNREA